MRDNNATVEITTNTQREKEMNDAQRKRLEGRLLAERSRIRGVLDRMNRTARSADERDQSGDISIMPTHPADIGSDEQQRELDTSVNQNEAETLAEIDSALERLYKTPERYGVDERSGEPDSDGAPRSDSLGTLQRPGADGRRSKRRLEFLRRVACSAQGAPLTLRVDPFAHETPLTSSTPAFARVTP